MTQYFKQLIFCKTNSSYNTVGLTADSLISGTAFTNYLPLSQLGVQALPGTKFYLNGNNEPVIVGFSGVFTIDLSKGGFITQITFDQKSIQSIENNPQSMLIIDMAYLGG